MRSATFAFASLLAASATTESAAAQVFIQRTVPRVIYRQAQGTSGLHQRVAEILGREVRSRFDYQRFLEDLTALGRPAAPVILAQSGRKVADRYVTEALLRVGGPTVETWVDEVTRDEDPEFREAFLTGVPAMQQIDNGVRDRLEQFLYDLSPRVRVAAVRKFYTLVPADQMLVRCRDMQREVVRAAVETVSDHWLFLDHGDRELENLTTFLGILDMHRRDADWKIGRGFLLALQKDRIAASPGGKKLIARAAGLPWFRRSTEGVTDAQLRRVRTRLAEAGDRDQAIEIVAKSLSGMAPRAGAELLLVLADSPDAGIRLAACEAGLRLLDPELAAAFVGFLKDRDPEVRARAKSLLEDTSFYAGQRRRWGSPHRL